MMNLNLSILRLDLQYIVLLFHYFLLFFNIVGMPLAPSNKNYLIRESGTATPGGTFDPKILFSFIFFQNLSFLFYTNNPGNCKLNLSRVCNADI